MLRFSIRDPLWLIAFAVLGMGWHADHRATEEGR